MSTRCPIPVIGAGGGGKGGGGSGGSPSEDPDSLRSRQYARVLDLISEGPIVGLVNGLKSIYLNDTPLQAQDGTFNFQGVSAAWRTGEQAQAHIPGFDEVESEIAVGAEVKASASVTRSVTGSVDAVRITVSVPQLTYQDYSASRLTGTSVTLAVDVNNAGGGWQQVLQDTISGKTTSRYQRSYRVPLPAPGPWDIRVRRITPDSTNSALQNKTWWDSYTLLTEAKLRYPNSALVALEMDASQFQSVPTRGYDMKLCVVSVPVNYDPETRTYSGTWNGTFKQAWTDNPAWIFYDLLTHPRYGLGQFIDATQVDKWALYQVAQYCDELVPNGFGGLEPRFTCNLYLQTRQEAFAVLQQLASVFRAMLYWREGQVVAVQDAPSDPVALFTPANVIDGAFEYQGAGTKAIHTVALVQWNDPSDMYRPAIEYVADEAGIACYGVIETNVVAVGCTSRGQAHRLGKWLLYSERLESETITFRAALDAAYVTPGAVIKVQDPVRAGKRFGGRITSATTSQVTLDAPVTLEAGQTYQLSVILPTGAVATSGVTTTAGATSVLSLSPALPSAPQAGAIWVLAASNLAPTTWRVLAVQETGDGQTCEIVALAHNPSKYAAIEQGLKLETPPVTALDRGQAPQAPAGLSASESLYRAGPGTIATRLTASWQQVPFASEYLCELRGRNVNIGYSQTVRGKLTSADFAPVEPGDYTLYVRGISALGVQGQRTSLDVTVQGLAAPPADVTGLTWATEGYAIRLKWNAVPDIDVAGYELRVGPTWASGTLIAQVAATTYLWQAQATGTLTVWIAAVDSTGNYSQAPTSVSIAIAAPPAPAVTWALDGPDEVLSWTAAPGTFAIDRYEVRYGPSWAAGTPIGSVKASLLRRRVDYGGSRSWWVAAIDVAGNVGTAGRVDVTVNPLGQVQSLSAEVIDNNVLLRWRDPPAAASTLPVDHYIVRKGATWAGGDPNSDLTVSGTFATLFEQASGQYTYHIAPVDTAGTVGSPRPVTAQVAQPPDYVLRTQVQVDMQAQGARTNALAASASTLLLPVNTTETWQAHFTSRSWSTPQQQIDAGYPRYLQPGPGTGSYQVEIDYGSVLPATMATVAFTAQAITGSASVVCQIDYRASTSDPWTAAPAGALQALIANVRYFRVTLSVSGAATDLVQVDGLSIKLANKLRTDSGRGTITDATNGVWVPFNAAFIDADTPLVQPEGATPLLPVVDFSDVPNPTGFRVYLYTTAGAKTTGSFSWTARGY